MLLRDSVRRVHNATKEAMLALVKTIRQLQAEQTVLDEATNVLEDLIKEYGQS